jgi:hypothetical protein
VRAVKLPEASLLSGQTGLVDAQCVADETDSYVVEPTKAGMRRLRESQTKTVRRRIPDQATETVRRGIRSRNDGAATQVRHGRLVWTVRQDKSCAYPIDSGSLLGRWSHRRPPWQRSRLPGGRYHARGDLGGLDAGGIAAIITLPDGPRRGPPGESSARAKRSSHPGAHHCFTRGGRTPAKTDSR